MARVQMALASTYAGLAFTRANVGKVHAIAHHDGMVVFVPFAAPGDRLQVEITERDKSFVRGRIVEPVTVRRLIMIGSRSASPLLPSRKAMITSRPSRRTPT